LPTTICGSNERRAMRDVAIKKRTTTKRQIQRTFGFNKNGRVLCEQTEYGEETGKNTVESI
jgi:hypothetical protein